MFEESQRVKRLPPYLFAEIDNTKQSLKRKGVSFIDLSIGDPDILAPGAVVETLRQTCALKENQKYALDQGKVSLRMAIKKWFKERFKVDLDESSEILPLIGSKEGLVHLPLAFLNPSDYVIIPDPGYPGYRGGCIFAGAKIYEVALKEEDGFLPRLETIPLEIRNKAKLLYLNYPNNPTTALAPKEFLERLVSFCSRYGVILAYDNAYSELYFDHKPYSIFQIKGAREVAIEFHSFSKTFCMTGFRLGWASGNEHLIKGLSKVKANIDSGIFGAIQEAGCVALRDCGGYRETLRATLRERRDIFVQGLGKKGFKNVYAASTFYVWTRIPSSFTSSLQYSTYLLKEKKIVATPGVGFGSSGEGFIRFALTVDKKVLEEALTLI